MFPSKVVNLTCANLQYRVCCPVAQREGSIKCIKIGVVIAKVTAGLKGTQLNFCILNVHLCIWQMGLRYTLHSGNIFYYFLHCIEIKPMTLAFVGAFEKFFRLLCQESNYSLQSQCFKQYALMTRSEILQIAASFILFYTFKQLFYLHMKCCWKTSCGKLYKAAISI